MSAVPCSGSLCLLPGEEFSLDAGLMVGAGPTGKSLKGSSIGAAGFSCGTVTISFNEVW